MPEHEGRLRECQQMFDEHDRELTGLKRTLFGNDGLHGVCGCIKEKVSKKQLAVIAIAILSVLATFTVAGLSAWGNANDERKENKQSIAIVQKELVQLNKTAQQIEKNQMDPKTLLNEIKKIIRENMKDKQ